MATLKYSRQREAIKEFLAGTKEHPTADTVYMHVREEFPRISLGTVYRNLNLLADIGEITKITTPDGGDRFDAVTNPHYHVICTSCGRVIDLEMEPLQLISSILAVSCVTVAFCSNFLMVQDKANGTIRDLRISPMKSATLSLSYYIATLD